MEAGRSRIWLTWETQRRNWELADAFRADYFASDLSQFTAPIRYFLSGWHSFWRIARNRYQVVFAQCPSVVLALFVVFLRRFYNFIFIIDAHNSAVEAAHSVNRFRRALFRFSFARSDYVLVSNSRLAPLVQAAGGNPLVLPDKLPAIPPQPRPPWMNHSSKHLTIVLIASFAADEPIEEFLRAASNLASTPRIFVTGSRSRAGELLKFEDRQITFTGFLPLHDFEALLQHSDLIVDLTTRDNCLVCGAYEALAVTVPGLLSDTVALRDTFPRGFIFSSNSSSSFMEAIRDFESRRDQLRAESRAGKELFQAKWRDSFALVEEQIQLRESKQT